MSKKLTSRWSLKEPLYLEKTDKRYKKHFRQLKTQGFSDAETWGLDSVIAEFILPRLIRFKEVNMGFPGQLTSKQWDDYLDEMIFAFDWSLNHENEKYSKLTAEEQDKNWKRYEAGIELFAEWFRHLWW